MASVMAFQGRCWQKEKSASDNILAKQLPIPFVDVRFKSGQQFHSLLEFLYHSRDFGNDMGLFIFWAM